MPDRATFMLADGTIHAQTHRVRVRLRCPNSHVFGAHVVVALDIQSDPELFFALSSSGGQTASCPECGLSCAVVEPVLLHDPDGGRVALFVPDPLSHRELQYRADLLSCLADTERNWLPAYFVEFDTLVGLLALRTWQADTPRSSDGEQRRKKDSSSGPPAMEGGGPSGVVIKSGGPVIHSAFADLARSDSVLPPDPGTGEDEPIVLDEEDEDWLGDDEEMPALDRASQTRKIERPQGLADEAPADARTSEPDSVSAPAERASFVDSDVSFPDLMTAEMDDDEVEGEEAELPSDENELLDAFSALYDNRVSKKRTSSPESLPGSAASACLDGRTVVLERTLSAERASIFSGAGVELWCQLHVIERYPIIALVLVADPRRREARIHWLLDPGRGGHRELVRQLARRYRARIELHTPGEERPMSIELAGARETNARLILERSEEILGQQGTMTFDRAVEDFDGTPHILDRLPPPFEQGGQGPPAQLGEMLRLVDGLDDWLEERRYEYLIYTRSVPRELLEQRLDETLEAAIAMGAALPERLKARAVATGLAGDEAELAQKACRAFDRFVTSEDAPREELQAENFKRLLASCHACGTQPDYEVWQRNAPLLERYGLRRADVFRDGIRERENKAEPE